jgi:hypothetical protein
MVAVHNDYRLNGKPHTFWLFTKGDRAIKGEGDTDQKALDQCRALAGAEPQTAPAAPPAMSEGRYWTNQLNACWDRSMSDALKTAAQKALNYIENTEGELGMTLSCGDALRAALADTENQRSQAVNEQSSSVGLKKLAAALRRSAEQDSPGQRSEVMYSVASSLEGRVTSSTLTRPHRETGDQRS